MKKIAVVTDSTAYMPDALIKKHNIHIIPAKIHWDDSTLIDGVDITPAQFYERLDRSATIPSTSQPSAGDFLKLFNDLSTKYDEIIALLVSSGISGTINSAEVALNTFTNKPVVIIDTHSASGGLGMIVVEAAKAVSEGKSLKEIKQIAEDIVKKLKVFFVVDTLKYLHKGGRIGGASRYLGSALDIKPILYLDDSGKIEALEKVRTKKKATSRLVELAAEYANGKPVNVSVLHANVLEEITYLRDQLLEQLDCNQIDIYELSPAIGVHVGPGTIGIAIYPI